LRVQLLFGQLALRYVASDGVQLDDAAALVLPRDPTRLEQRYSPALLRKR
jgi:hypothetical protein